MNETSTIDIYEGWYGPTYYYFLSISFVLGIAISFGSGMVIWLALGSKEVRSLVANWFVIDLAVADFIFGFDKVAFVPVAFSLADKYPILCTLEACVHYTSGIVSMSVPPMMAACRYYTVTEGIQESSRNIILRFIFFTRKGAICLMVGCWTYFFIIAGVLLGFNQMGKDPNGYCGTKPFTSLPLFLFYIGSAVSFGFLATLITLIYYRKLSKFIAVQSAAHHVGMDNKETVALLFMIKIAAIQPSIFQTPFLIVLAGGFWLRGLPIWLTRLSALLFAFNALSDAWLTILILKPFQREFRTRVIEKLFNSNKVGPVQMSQLQL